MTRHTTGHHRAEALGRSHRRCIKRHFVRLQAISLWWVALWLLVCCVWLYAVMSAP